MDDHHVHHFWGLSPCVNLLELLHGADPGRQALAGGDAALLQVCPYDCRHTLATLAAAAAAAPAGEGPAPGNAIAALPAEAWRRVEVVVYEEDPQLLARHMLLIYALLDGTLPPHERVEAFLELHGSALLRRCTADWLVGASKVLESAVVLLSEVGSGGGEALAARDAGRTPDARQRGAAPSAPPGRAGDAARLAALFDTSLLRHQQRDALVEALQRLRSKAGFDMAAAWDKRCRRFYADRYDVRGNMVDYDYHMRLAPRGTPNLDPALGSINHFHHFRHWRLTGVAHELRGCAYEAPNTSLLSVARGRTKEYMDRCGRDVGRSVEAFGYWGDVLDGPFACFGVAAPGAPGGALFRSANRAFQHTSMDVAEHNVKGMLGALRRGARASAGVAGAGEGGDAGGAHRARAARGPTSAEQLAAAMAEAQISPGGAASNSGPGPSSQAAAGVAVTRSSLHSLAEPRQRQKEPQPEPEEAQQQAAQCTDDAAAAAAAADALRAADAAADADAWARLLAVGRVRFASGDLGKALSSRAARGGAPFSAATCGRVHAHLAGAADAGLASALAPGAPLLIEGARGMSQITAQQVEAFEARVRELAAGARFEGAPPALAEVWGPLGHIALSRSG